MQKYTEKTLEEKPWYKQFWPLFVFSLPAASVIAGLITVVIAFRNADSVVADDYYKEGMAINQRLDKRDHARELGIQAEMGYAGELLTVGFLAKRPDVQQLSVTFRHATLAHKDFSVQLKMRPDGSYFANIPNDMSGKWRVVLQPGHQQWELVSTWILPAKGKLKLS